MNTSQDGKNLKKLLIMIIVIRIISILEKVPNNQEEENHMF